MRRTQQTDTARRWDDRYTRSLLASALLVGLVGLAACGGKDEPVAAPAGADIGAMADSVSDVVADAVLDGAVLDGTSSDVVHFDQLAADSATPGCASDSDCAGDKPHCDVAAGACVPCLLNHHCAKGEVCLDAACVAPISCKTDKGCTAAGGVCWLDTTSRKGGEGQCVACNTTDDCNTGYTCRGHHCLAKPKACASSKACADMGGVCDKTAGYCVDCVGDDDCTATEYCVDGLCLADVCAAGDAICESPGARRVCQSNGGGWQSQPCASETACDAGICKPIICTPDAKRCAPVKPGDQPGGASGAGLGSVQVCGKRGVAWKAAAACATKTTCVDGACLPQSCDPGEQRCSDKGVQTCADTGLDWLALPCTATETCVEVTATGGGKTAACTPMICTPGSLVCDGDAVAECDAKGLATKVTQDCSQVPENLGTKGVGDGTVAGTCVAGACQVKACTDGAKACGAAAALTCKKGVWLATTCPAGQTCTAGTCVPVSCVPKETWCDLSVIKTCNAKGDGATWVTDCKALGKGCKAGACVDYACLPGKQACSADNSTANTCKLDGSGWVAVPCGAGQICEAGACKKVVCAAGKAYCEQGQRKVCNALGTAVAKTEVCADGKSCQGGACVDHICKPGEKRCKKAAAGAISASVETCAVNGLSWQSSACASKQACVSGACEAVVCIANAKSCVGQAPDAKPQQCNATGTAQVVGQSCAAGKSCQNGACVDQLCKPGEKRCKKATAGAVSASVETCAVDGLSWQATGCASKQACVSGACEAVICTPGSKSCLGAAPNGKPQLCNATGTAHVVGQPCDPSAVCSAGTCLTATCATGQTRCDGLSKLQTCRVDRLGWVSQPCGAGEACSAGACKAVICQANKRYCAKQDVMLCDASGTAAKKESSCAAGTLCVGGQCKKLVCKPGATTCGTGATAGKLLTCGKLGLSWQPGDCASGTVCDTGACKPLVCKPKALSCAGKDVLQCNALGTATSKLTSCTGGKLCLQGACVNKVCVPKSVTCTNNSVRTCNADGTAFSDKPCGTNAICKDDGSGLTCVKQICNPASKYCNSSRIVSCTADGTSWESKIDCALSKASCVLGACKPWICTPKSVQCQGDKRATCADDGLSWKQASCSDGDACTVDTCKASKCVSGPRKACDDGNLCTKDGCDKSTGKCTTSAITGACDDGSVCTTGETCTGGKCLPPKWGKVDTYAGTGSAGVTNGDRLKARFYNPTAVSAMADGTLFVADLRYNVVRKISASGQVSTFAGVASTYGTFADGKPGRFKQPFDVAATAQGGVYVADRLNSRVRYVDPGGTVSTVSTGFYYPQGVALGTNGSVLVANTGRHDIWQINTATKQKVKIAGVSGAYGFKDGPTATARFYNPAGLAAGPSGRIYVADQSNHRIRLVHNGIVSTVAGGSSGFQDGAGSVARFSNPRDVTLDQQGALWVADLSNRRLRRISPSGVVSTVAFSGLDGFLDGVANQARSTAPYSITIGPKGHAYVADYNNHRIRRLIPSSVDCGDGNPCTADLCDAKTGACSHKAISAGASCDDGDACTLKETCDSKGACVGKAKDCSDGKPCTLDNCNSATGACSNPVSNGACSDGDACTLGDGCKNGTCVTGLGVIETAIGTGVAGRVDGDAKKATLYGPIDLAVDRNNTVWWVEGNSHSLRRMGKDGMVVTVAGGTAGFVDGSGLAARFNAPQSIALGKGGILFVSDANNRRVRRVSPAGVVSTYAGDGGSGFVDGPAAKARFTSLAGIAVRSDGAVVVADTSVNRVRAISTGGMVTTLAGSGAAGYLDGPGSSARFYYPRGVAANSSGDVFVTDQRSFRVRKISNTGMVITVAGSGYNSFSDGAATSARFGYMWHLAVMKDGGLLVSDYSNGRLRRILNGQVSTVIGYGSYTDGGLNIARLTKTTYGVTVAPDGQVWLADTGAQRIRKLSFGKLTCDDGNTCTTDSCDKSKGCVFTTIKVGQACDDGDACTTATACDKAGKCSGKTKGCGDGNACTLDSCDPYTGSCANEAITATCDDGNACTTGESCYEKNCTAELPKLTTLAGSSGGFADGKGSAARFNNPYGMTRVGKDLWVADFSNHRIRKIAPDGTVTTLAGSGKAGFADGQTSSAQFNRPMDVDATPGGNALVADRGNHRIRQVTATGQVGTYAGTGAYGYLDGSALTARFYNPSGLAIAADGRVVVADMSNQRVRLITTTGTVTTLAGSGQPGFVDGAASSARFNSPAAVDLDKLGNAYVADSYNHRLRKITTAGLVTTVAGSGSTGTSFGPATSAALGYVQGVTVAPNGTIYLALPSSNRVVRLAGGVVSAFFGDGSNASSDGVGTAARTYRPGRVTTDGVGQLYVSEYGSHRIRMMAFAAKDCDDGSPCTTDSCDAKTGSCINKAAQVGSSCTDGSACTLKDQCNSAGKCVGKAKSCDDSNVCTTDSCNALTGVCSNLANTNSCDDGDACTTGETCWQKACKNTAGLVTTIAGTTAGYLDGAAAKARFSYPWDVENDGAGGWFIADRNNHRIRRLSASGQVTTVAGSGASGYLDGAGTSAKFTYPSTILRRADGTLVVFGRAGRLRTVSKTNVVGTLAGSGSPGLLDGYVTSARFGPEPGGMAETKAGALLIADYNNHRVRAIDGNNNVTTFAGSSAGYLDGAQTSAKFSGPADVAVGPTGAVFVADYNNRRIRKIAGGQVTTLAGSGTNGWLDGANLSARFGGPRTVDVDALGRIFVADVGNSQRIRLISGGKVSSLAGSGVAKSVDGFGAGASLFNPWGATLGSDGHYYFAEQSSHRVRRLLVPRKICTDGKPCTVDACDKASGKCSFALAKAGSACTDLSKPCQVGMTCSAGGTCQGGSVNSCDDKNPCTIDSCDSKTGACSHTYTAAGGCKKVHRVFVTSAVYDGNLGGLAGGDKKCQALATAAGLGGTWQAWLSTTTDWPAKRFPQDGAAYRRVDGVQIAASWSDLVDGSLSAGIDVTEQGKKLTATTSSSGSACGSSWRPSVHTGTSYNGVRGTSYYKYICANWYTNTSSYYYRSYSGRAGATNTAWTQGCSGRCYSSYRSHLYCFEKTLIYAK